MLIGSSGPEINYKKYTTGIVSVLKDRGEDFSFYPTTTQIINIIKHNLRKNDNGEISQSILDCGAGDGRVLSALTNGKKYAIEKSQILVKGMAEDIFIVGCDFFENTLIDKKVDVVFSNPPYSVYKEWSIKIINESNANDIFLVIPERWKNQPDILSAIKDREATYKIIGSADFLDADRQARAKVDIIRIYLKSKMRNSYYNNDISPEIDPFRFWVEKEFPIETRGVDSCGISKEELSQRINELVPGRGLAQTLVELYNRELMTLQDNYRNISNIDSSIFKELQIDFKSIIEFLRNRIEGLKSKYWRELFSNLDSITNRLTTKSRKELLDTLIENISVDFNESNIYAVTLWAIKNANKYFDSQLIDVFMDLVDRANLIKYKSNQKTFGEDKWRFREDVREGKISHFGLDYRCVISCFTTFSNSDYERYDYPNGLHKNIHNKLNDILVVAGCLGFVCPSWETSFQKEWEPGKTNDFYINKMKKDILFSVKVYKNGNVHFKFNQKFLRTLNCEFGRLKGWLRSHKEASEELGIPELEAKSYFKSNYILECSSVKLLTKE